MARKELSITITAEGRDKGKAFFIREMPASQSEKWAIRALLAMGKGGIEVPEGAERAGFAGIARMLMTLIVKLPYDDAEVLLDEMFRCIQIQPDPQRPNVVRALVEDDIEEVSTRITLRAEVFKLHAGFLSAAA